MKTNIELNGSLIKEAMRLSKSRSKKGVAELALQNFIARIKRENMIKVFGKVECVAERKRS